MNKPSPLASLNARGASLVMALIRKEITLPEARAQLPQTKAPSCRIGRHGVCITHGQPIEECENSP